MWFIPKNNIKLSNILPQLYCTIIELTLSCNLNCIHCWSYAWKKRDLELEKKDIFKLIDDLAILNCMQITLMWWEFWLRKDRYEIAKYVKLKNIELVIISNWYRLPDKILDQIYEIQPYSVAFSIDWIWDIHNRIRWRVDAFEKTSISIRKILENWISVWIISTINKKNIWDLAKIREFLYWLSSYENPLRWQIQTAAYWSKLIKDDLVDENDFENVCKFIYDSQKEERYDEKKLYIVWADDIWYFSKCYWENISATKDWIWCKAWINVLWIQSNWNVLWCLSLPDNFIEWNILEKSIIEIWNDKNSFKYSRNFDINDVWENCKDCEKALLCKWWCNEVSFSRTWKIHNSPFCLYRKEKWNNKINF